MIKKVISNSLVYAIAPQVPRIVSVFMLPLLTSYLTPLDYGVSATIIVYTGLLAGLKDLGLTVQLVNAFYHTPNSWILRWRIIYGYLLLWAPIVFILQGVVVYFATPTEAKAFAMQIALLTSVPVLLFEHTAVLGFRYLHAVKKDAMYLAFCSLVPGLVIVACNYITIVEWRMGYMGWFWSTFIGSIASWLLLSKPIYFNLKLRPIIFPNRNYLAAQMKIAMPMIPHSYSSYLLNSSDRLIMDVLKINISNIGVYNLAYSFGSYFEIIGNSMGLAIGPYINDMLAEKTSSAEIRLRRMIFFFQFAFILTAFLAGLWIKEIFELLINNEQLRQSYPLAIVIIMAYCYRPLYWGCVNRLIYYKKTHQLWRISFVAGLLSIGLNLCLMPFFGFKIAVLTTFISLMYIGISGYYIKDFKDLSGLDYKPLQWLFMITACTVTAYILRDASIYSKLFITVSILSLSTYAVFRHQDKLRFE